MPVPKSSVTPEPRTLLRDVVYAKLVSAIQDGTLVPGERLNDVELTDWLGVSRTPVREAISRLVSEGLVEMAANRYTRVSDTSAGAFEESSALLSALQEWALDHSDSIDRSVLEGSKARIDKLAVRLGEHEDITAYRLLQDELGLIVAGLGNALFADTERAARGRVKFHASAPGAPLDWDAALRTIDRVRSL